MATIAPHSAPLVTAGADYPLSPTEVFQSLNAKKQLLERLSKQSGDLVSTMSEMTENTGDAAKYSRELIDNLDFLIEDITALNDSLDVYYPDLQDALTDAQELVNRTTEALNSGISTMTILQNTLKNSSDDFDAAARESLRGSMALLDKSLDILDSTTAMRRAGRTMKDTLDNELDKFDTDNRFLFMDPEACLLYTSAERRDGAVRAAFLPESGNLHRGQLLPGTHPLLFHHQLKCFFCLDSVIHDIPSA